jgi:tRNA modification GTPase
VEVLAEIEARIDFADDLPPLDETAVQAQIEQIRDQVSRILETANQGELLRSGLKVAIVGRPNVGKSSLLNAWSRCDRAIVTNLPGTTRDVVESQLVVGGIPIQVLDTAGIRAATDQVEQIGVARSRAAAQSADLVLMAMDAAAGWTEADQILYDEVKHRPLILVLNKVDLVDAAPILDVPEALEQVKTSAAEHQGIDQLEAAILSVVQTQGLTAADLDIAINRRQAAALTRAQAALQQVHQTIQDQLPLDFWTIDLRGAIQALGEITGEEMTESMLDQIFSRFCIGK